MEPDSTSRLRTSLARQGSTHGLCTAETDRTLTCSRPPAAAQRRSTTMAMVARHLPRQRHRARGVPKGKEPTNHLYRNKGNGTFEDVTARAGLTQSGWGQGACAGDYDNDGDDDLFVTYWGQNRLYQNKVTAHSQT